MSDNLTDRLQRTFDRARAASEQRGFIYGTVGRQNENGRYSVVVAGRPNYLYVTVDGEQASTIARAGATPRVAGLPVRMKREQGEQGELVIVDVNQLALGAFLSGGAGGYNVAFHHHNEGSGLEYAINSSRLKQGRVRFVSALTVHIGEFAYSHLGDWRWWPGGNIDLTSVQPAGADTWAWVLVGVDPSTNAAVAVAGAAQAVGTALTVEQLESIAFNGYIPCGAVRVRADDTALNLASRYADARIWLDRLGASGGGASALDDLTDVNVPTPTDNHVLTYDAGTGLWLDEPGFGDVVSGWNFIDPTESVGILTGTLRSSGSFATQTTTVLLGKVMKLSGVEWHVGDAGTYDLKIDGETVGVSVVAAADDTTILFDLSASPYTIATGAHTFSISDAGGVRRARYYNTLSYQDRYFRVTGWDETAGNFRLPVRLTGQPGDFAFGGVLADVAGSIDGAGEKTTPVGADKFGLVESEAPDAGLLKWLSWTNLVAGVQAAIDSVYFRLTGRAGGQVAHGGTASGDSLTLRGSAHATSGGVVVDDDLVVEGQVNVGEETSPTGDIHVRFDRAGSTSVKVVNLTTESSLTFLEARSDTASYQAGAISSGFSPSGPIGPGDVFFQSNPGTLVIRTIGNFAVKIATNNVVRIFVADDGRVAIGESAPATSAKLDIQGTAGALLLPRLTTAQRNALTATFGMIIANTSTSTIQAYTGAGWVNL